MSTGDNFREKFKYYKSNNPKPSLREVLYVDSPGVNYFPVRDVVDARSGFLGLRKLSEWKTYCFEKHPGLIFIKNPFTSLGQRYWIKSCLKEYPRKPNKMNIDIEIDCDNWWKECFKTGQLDKRLQKKLRWTTLGYHHNWDTKEYSEKSKSDFPNDLAELSDVVASYLGFTGFKAEAAIVNYYHMDSTLSPHTDHSEVNLDAPLLSFSFGQTAIFLIGGTDKLVLPSAIYINSGDIIVMSKEARLCYHAVPRILSAPNQRWNEELEQIEETVQLNELKFVSDSGGMLKNMNENIHDWSMFNSYISQSRINMNVRQVLNETQSSLKDLCSDCS